MARNDDSNKSGEKNPRFSLIIPAYEEERRLPASLRDIRTFFGSPPPPGAQLEFEAIVVIEKSRDRSVEVAREATKGDSRFTVVDNLVHRGKGFAVKSGMLRARGEIVFFMDADLSTPLAEVIAFLAHLEQNPKTHVAIGSRALAKSLVLRRQNPFRQTLGRGFNRFVRLFGLTGITDTQCGFKAFRSHACREIFERLTIDGFAFDVEALMLARKLGCRIDVLPVRWVNSPASKVRIWIDPFKMLWDLIRIRRIVRQTLRVRPLAEVIPPSI